tara:strand:+ start:7763 stop:8044 length:282 start_codon:yes stop_codon:yes gene_type:complete
MSESEKRVAEAECDECWWHGEEAKELTDRSHLYDLASEWLRKKEIGLETPRDLLTIREEQAIYVVWCQQEGHKARSIKDASKHGKGGHHSQAP